MKFQKFLIAVTVVNTLALIYTLARPRTAEAQGVAPVLRGRALQIVDEQGRVRASITLFPADPKVKMPDGTTGYPETVLLRLINSKGRPTVKIAALEDGSNMGLGGDTDPAYVSIQARGTTTSLKLTNQEGKEQLIRP